MAGERVTQSCAQCGQPFTHTRAILEKRKHRFCSNACFGEYRRGKNRTEIPWHTCPECGNRFQRRVSTGAPPPKYCSAKCSGKARRKPRPATGPLIQITCRVCGVAVETRNASRLYCSAACQRRRAEPHATMIACEYCQEPFKPRTASSRFCSRPCLYAGGRRERSAGWKGGRHVNQDGYVKVYEPDHPKSDNQGYVLEHRLVMEGMVGRPLHSNESVHHINGDRGDNRPENLQLRQGRHGAGTVWHCLDCGSNNVRPVPIAEATVM